MIRRTTRTTRTDTLVPYTTLYRSRVAPSPTGRLHVGNIRAALHNWLWARKSGGRFLLRLDDTDAERSTEAFARSIRDDLVWLGLVPDTEVRQSARTAVSEARFEEIVRASRGERGGLYV